MKIVKHLQFSLLFSYICFFGHAQTFEVKYKGQISDSSTISSGYNIYFSYTIYVNADYAYILTKQDSTNFPLIQAHTDDEEFLIDYKSKVIFDLVKQRGYPITPTIITLQNKVDANTNTFALTNPTKFSGVYKMTLPAYIQPGTFITGLPGGVTELHGPNQHRYLKSIQKKEFDFAPIIRKVKKFPISKQPLNLL